MKSDTAAEHLRALRACFAPLGHAGLQPVLFEQHWGGNDVQRHGSHA
jgi:hypothetical protein